MVTRLYCMLIGSMKIGVCIHVSVYTVEIAVKLSNFVGSSPTPVSGKKCIGNHLSYKKKQNLLLAMESWLLNRGPYNLQLFIVISK